MYQRILNSLQDFFGISRKEARGALVMMALCLVTIWSPYLFRRWVLPALPAGDPSVEIRVLDSVATLLEKKQSGYYPQRRRAGFTDDATKNTRVFVVTDFDPNLTSEQGLQALGIPAFLAKRVEKFRSKGGRFRNKEDLLKIYDFPQTLYERLEPHIKIAAQVTGQAERPNNHSKGGLPPQRIAQNPITFDINQCDTTQLIRLKGIGSKLSQRILKFRDALGGFHSTDQFSEIYGLDSLALSELRRYAKVISGVRKININVATAAELGGHSYLRNRKAVSVLINYREQHGPFRSLEELRNVKLLDETTIQKIGPYLSF